MVRSIKERAQMNFDRVFGTVCIVLGIGVILFALNQFILRVAMAVVGLFLVNFGLKLCGMPPLYIIIMRMWSSRYNF